MKLSMESYVPVRRFGEKEGLKMIKDAGFDCVDFSYCGLDLDAPAFGEEYIEYSKDVRAYLDDIGLECCQAHAPYVMTCNSTFELSDVDYRATVRSIESAALLGAKAIVVHTVIVPEGVKEFTMWEFNQRYYKSLIPYAQKAGIRIAVENLYIEDEKTGRLTGRLGSPDELTAFVKELDSPYIAACVDVGHASITGYKPEEFIVGMDGSVLKAIHIHDGDYKGDRHMLPYLGRFHWKEILEALKSKGYEGPLNFEIVTYLLRFPKELIPQALALAAKTGKHMTEMFENL